MEKEQRELRRKLQLAKELYTREGFMLHYEKECQSGGQYKDAYSRTEELHSLLFGERKFPSLEAFKNYLKRNKQKPTV